MDKLKVYIDGGARGNPGPAAIGVIIYDKNNNPLKKYSQFLGENLTNNEAEYLAAIFAFKKIKLLYGKKRIKDLDLEIKSDSELLVKQIEGKYKILEQRIQKLFIEIWNLKIDFKSVKFVLIPRSENKEADKLVNEALDNYFLDKIK